MLNSGNLPSKRSAPKIGVIFSGTGKRISQAERDLYADGVHVLFQKKAWADRQVCLNSAETSLKDHLALSYALSISSSSAMTWLV